MARAGSRASEEIDPTARVGPYRVRRRRIGAQDAYGSSVVSYPVAPEGMRFGAVAVVPGYTGHRLTVAWYGARLASFGFVVTTINTLGRRDTPPARATQLLAALAHLRDHPATAQRVDPARSAVIGHSMGGSGALLAASQEASLRAVVALMPWSQVTRWPRVTTPSLIIAGGRDRVAPPDAHAHVAFDGLPPTTPSLGVELPAASHYTPLLRPRRVIQLATVGWLRAHLDDDPRALDATLAALRRDYPAVITRSQSLE